jgi:hypothetical protein
VEDFRQEEAARRGGGEVGREEEARAEEAVFVRRPRGPGVFGLDVRQVVLVDDDLRGG